MNTQFVVLSNLQLDNFQHSFIRPLLESVLIYDCFPQGSVKHLQLQAHELRDYEQQLESVLRRYLRRLQWLLGASRRTFGTVIEKKVSFIRLMNLRLFYKPKYSHRFSAHGVT